MSRFLNVVASVALLEASKAFVQIRQDSGHFKEEILLAQALEVGFNSSQIGEQFKKACPDYESKMEAVIKLLLAGLKVPDIADKTQAEAQEAGHKMFVCLEPDDFEFSDRLNELKTAYWNVLYEFDRLINLEKRLKVELAKDKAARKAFHENVNEDYLQDSVEAFMGPDESNIVRLCENYESMVKAVILPLIALSRTTDQSDFVNFRAPKQVDKLEAFADNLYIASERIIGFAQFAMDMKKEAQTAAAEIFKCLDNKVADKQFLEDYKTEFASSSENRFAAFIEDVVWNENGLKLQSIAEKATLFVQKNLRVQKDAQSTTATHEEARILFNRVEQIAEHNKNTLLRIIKEDE